MIAGFIVTLIAVIEANVDCHPFHNKDESINLDDFKIFIDHGISGIMYIYITIYIFLKTLPDMRKTTLKVVKNYF